MAQRATREPLSVCDRFIDLTRPEPVIEWRKRTRPEGESWQVILRRAAQAVDAVVVGLVTAGFVAMTRGGSQPLAVGLAGGVFWFVLERIDPGNQWRRVTGRSVVFPRGTRHLVWLPVGIAIAWETSGFGLSLLPAALAVATAMLISSIIRLVVAGVTDPPATKRAIVVGPTVLGRRVAQALAREGVEVVGLVDDLLQPPDLHGVDLVVFALSSPADHEAVEAIRACRLAGTAVATVSTMHEGVAGRVAVGRVGGLPLLSLHARWHERRMPRLSRLIDIVVAGGLLVFTLPLTVAIVAAVLVDSGRPVLYRAPRLGRGGERFAMLKFRTMSPNAAGPFVTGADDPRVTRVGRFLRSSKLDELPQLWNVLRGEMALVGPRPQSPCYAALYEDAYRDILRVRPGVTGLYQIQFRDEASLLIGADFEDRYCTEFLRTKIMIDRYYVEHATLGLDCKILAKTPLVVLRRARVDDRGTCLTPSRRGPKEESPVIGVGV